MMGRLYWCETDWFYTAKWLSLLQTYEKHELREIKDVGRGVKLRTEKTRAARLLYNLKKAIYLCVSISPSFRLWVRLPAILRG